MLLASLHAASRAHRNCHSVSSWDRSSNFGALGPRSWEDHLGKSVRATDFGLECMHDVPRLQWIEHIGLVSVCLSSSAKSMKTSTAPYPEIMQPNCRVIFNIATALLSPFFLDLLLGCSSTWRCAYEHFSPICIHSRTSGTSILEDATFHRMEWCKFPWGNPCTAVETFFHLGLFPLGLLVLDAFLTFCRMKEFGEGFGCVDFAHLLISCRKLQVSPLEHCPLASHCQQSPGLLCSRCFVPWFLTTAFVS